jgi:hypothetical protein
MLEQHIVIEEHFGFKPILNYGICYCSQLYCMYQGRGGRGPEKEEE